MSSPVISRTVGFPRMGTNRQLKFALEKYWRSKITLDELNKVAREVEASNWKKQLDAKVDKVSVGLFSYYDHVLDWTYYLGTAPARFDGVGEGLDKYFAMARGVDGTHALDMTKWFDTNYHYEVPELNESTSPKANFGPLLAAFKRAKEALGADKVVPTLLGPLTYLSLSKYSNTSLEEVLEKILPLYSELLEEIAGLGFSEIQVHEPSLVTSNASKVNKYLSKVYGSKDATGVIEKKGLSVNLVTYFDAIDEEAYKWFSNSNVASLSLDFTRGDNLSLLQKHGFPSGKTLGAGIIDGRGIWKFQPSKVVKLIGEIKAVLSKSEGSSLAVQTSCSLQHVPYTTECETDLQSKGNEGLYGVLSFAYEKLGELEVVKAIAAKGEEGASDVISAAQKAWDLYHERNPAKGEVKDRLSKVTEKDLVRPAPFEERRPHQLKNCPILPTTTIGSFPQTAQIRALRRKLKRGEISLEHYEQKIDEQIAFNIGVQEGLGLDILVHGEPERTDMVEFFAEKLDGFAFTQNGWVQSYGSRCVRPPVIYADLVRPSAMTTREFVVAQSFTSKPVKGMLTGPVTILNWSFPRQDISRKEQANQLALCLRDEVSDLEAAKCSVIQMDEPALREGMPLKVENKDEYLKWAVDAFRLSTAVAAVGTSMHTHMCYCEFGDCMPAIDALDTDVNSIENARSGDETIRAFNEIGYHRDLGPGTYDIHSPVVPPKEEIVSKLKSFLNLLEPKQIVVNPDCGLKTRKWPETIAALKNMVEATVEVRASL